MTLVRAEITTHAIRDCAVAKAIWYSLGMSGDDKVRLSNRAEMGCDDLGDKEELM